MFCYIVNETCTQIKRIGEVVFKRITETKEKRALIRALWNPFLFLQTNVEVPFLLFELILFHFNNRLCRVKKKCQALHGALKCKTSWYSVKAMELDKVQSFVSFCLCWGEEGTQKIVFTYINNKISYIAYFLVFLGYSTAACTQILFSWGGKKRRRRKSLPDLGMHQNVLCKNSSKGGL